MSIKYSYVKDNKFEYVDIPINSLILRNSDEYEVLNFNNIGVYQIYKSGGNIYNFRMTHKKINIIDKEGVFPANTTRNVICNGIVNITNKDMTKPIIVTLNIHNSTVTFNVNAVPYSTHNFTIKLTNEYTPTGTINYSFTSDSDFEVNGIFSFEMLGR